MFIRLGNKAPIEVIRADDGTETTYNIEMPTDVEHVPCEATWPDDEEGGFAQLLAAVLSPQGFWVQHSTEPPAWVSSDDDLLAKAVARAFQDAGHEVAVVKPERVSSIFVAPELATMKATRDGVRKMAARVGAHIEPEEN